MTQHDAVITVGSVGTLLSSVIAPAITILVGILTAIYTGIRVYESKTVQAWLAKRRG